MIIFLTISFFWFLRTIRIILFYIYLWQLKEYHTGRFLDHFRTEKGKWLFLNPLKILKIALISGFFLFPLFFPLVLGFFYISEFMVFTKDLFKGTLKRPVLTKKTGFISILAIFLAILVPIYFYYLKLNLIQFSFWLLIIDIFTPVLVSGIILLFQPIAVLARNRIIKKAKEKRAKFSARGGSATGGKDLLVIGITGSYGKTSTKEFLYTILSQKYNVLKTKEHQNSEVGISQCILNDLKPGHEIFICEMGAYGRGGVKLLSEIVKPQIGILTGVNEQHLALFGSMENLISAEGGEELIKMLPENGLAIFNGNNKYCFDLYNQTRKPKKLCFADFNLEKPFKPDIWAQEVKVEKDFISFKVFDNKGEKMDFRVNLIGGFNVQNIILAVMAAKELNMSLSEISNICKEKIKMEQGAMKLIKGKNGLNIIDSTYSANPDGVISALEYLKIWPGKKIIVMPCLIELGKASKEVHKKIGRKIGEICHLAIITTKDRFKEIKEGARLRDASARQAGEKVLFIENPQEIFEKIKEFCKEGDAVLLESRVPKKLISLLVS